jgi:hypothetical protein
MVELMKVKGFGEWKAKKYGDQIISIIAETANS